jgi:hypothetical protein
MTAFVSFFMFRFFERLNIRFMRRVS